MMKLIRTFRNFAKAPKIGHQSAAVLPARGGGGASGGAAPDGRVQGAPKWAALMFKNETIKDIFTLLFLN